MSFLPLEDQVVSCRMGEMYAISIQVEPKIHHAVVHVTGQHLWCSNIFMKLYNIYKYINYDVITIIYLCFIHFQS